jgi:hypothetical protein
VAWAGLDEALIDDELAAGVVFATKGVDVAPLAPEVALVAGALLLEGAAVAWTACSPR